ncbi:hypothetical protein DFQ28_008858 [Apophysomyces sp. BC1034]|nr:hypothetical protein DFQ30_005258 [Apophysomyces sp. BC1015]KAG0183366.1 hypothetical protein DFQ29_005742 [Apophysomyces sp. BC1021]KAG0194599.1 hypothetical protein DFQ28_008858 [Apophysomyces sp. BC1034]
MYPDLNAASSPSSTTSVQQYSRQHLHPTQTTTANMTTLTIVSVTPGPNNGSYAKQQQNENGNNNGNDPNLVTVGQEIKHDQTALHRMVLIVSLVGGIGVIAIIAATVVLARMRMRKRKSHQEAVELQTQETHNDNDNDNDNDSDNGNSNGNHNDNDEQQTEPHTELDDTHIFPAVPELIYYEPGPPPSAPTAKELDAPEVPPLLSAGPSVVLKHAVETPDIPPPAYTPSAPPLYALPMQRRHDRSASLQRSSSF